MKEGKTSVQVSMAEVRSLYNQLIASGHAPREALQNAIGACAYWALAIHEGEEVDFQIDTLPLAGTPRFRLTLSAETDQLGEGIEIDVVPFEKAR